MNDFNSEIKNRLNHKNPIIFDVGCFNGNFSRKLIKDLKLKKVNLQALLVLQELEKQAY